MSGTVQSLTRGLNILRVLSDSPQGLALREVAAGLSLKRPTAHKLLNTLIENGFAEKTSAPVLYRPGGAIFELARVSRSTAFLQRGTAAVQGLAHSLPRATVTLARLVGGEITTVLRMSPERKNFLERPVDVYMNPYHTASALLFQAYWTEEERAAYRRTHVFEDYETRLWRGLEDVDRFLDEIRFREFAAPPYRDGILRVAAPVFGPGGRIVAALGASGLIRNARNDRRSIETVCAAARGLSPALNGKHS